MPNTTHSMLTELAPPPRAELTIEDIALHPSPCLMPPETASLLLERVSGIYAGRFAEAIEGRACLERHGLTNAALLDRHRVGYCDGTLADLLPKEGPLKEELKALGILLNNGQERFLGCVVYPLYNPDGQLASMVAHAAADGPLHYRILPGRPQGLWNTAALKTYSEIILAPSPLDGLSVMTSGHANVTALCGTLELGEQHLALFKKHGIQKIILLPAGGKACPNASRLIQQLQAEGINSTVRMLPEGRDPNSFLLAHGPAKLAAFLAVRDTSSPPVGQPHLQPAERMAL